LCRILQLILHDIVAANGRKQGISIVKNKRNIVYFEASPLTQIALRVVGALIFIELLHSLDEAAVLFHAKRKISQDFFSLAPVSR
jgi:hypothetical protein